MEITEVEFTVSDIVEGYTGEEEDEEIRGYYGKLNIRPPYQREFIYSEKEQSAVIDTVLKGYPLNTMYWADCGDGEYEIIDGQQRTISICEFVSGVTTLNGKDYFNSLEEDKRQKIRSYTLKIYVCRGEPSEKLEWFETINIAGKSLTSQELRNAVYHGKWTTDARDWFSKPDGPAQAEAGKYLKGRVTRQEYLEQAIKWVCGSNSDRAIREYMSRNRNKNNAIELWSDFSRIIDWVKANITYDKRALVEGIDWGAIYTKHKGDEIDSKAFAAKAEELHLDDEVRSNSGIYPYLFSGCKDEYHLNLRTFSEVQKRRAYKRQGGKCAITGKEMDIKEMEADHIRPWSENGKTEDDNCQMVSIAANRSKSNK